MFVVNFEFKLTYDCFCVKFSQVETPIVTLLLNNKLLLSMYI